MSVSVDICECYKSLRLTLRKTLCKSESFAWKSTWFLSRNFFNDANFKIYNDNLPVSGKKNITTCRSPLYQSRHGCIFYNRTTLASFNDSVHIHEGCDMLLWHSYIFLIYFKKSQSGNRAPMIHTASWRMFCAEIVERIFTSFHIFNNLG